MLIFNNIAIYVVFLLFKFNVYFFKAKSLLGLF
jgi:hypothetical protein